MFPVIHQVLPFHTKLADKFYVWFRFRNLAPFNQYILIIECIFSTKCHTVISSSYTMNSRAVIQSPCLSPTLGWGIIRSSSPHWFLLPPSWWNWQLLGAHNWLLITWGASHKNTWLCSLFYVWWHHDMENIFALLVFVREIQQWIPHKVCVMWSFDISFAISLNKLLNNRPSWNLIFKILCICQGTISWM